MPSLDYGAAASLLRELFEEAEALFREGGCPSLSPELVGVADVLFASKTQSLREALLGCALARSLDRSINIRHPYVEHGDDAFSGRTLDERVVNPFLHDRLIPATKGPYLAAIRRGVRFTPDAVGRRDKTAYGAMMAFIAALEAADEDSARNLTLYLLCRFVALRDAAHVPVSRVVRLSVDQYRQLMNSLLRTPSGGRIPVLLTVAILKTMRACYGLEWQIEWQGINVADRASGAGGDVTMTRDEVTVLAIEVTERVIDGSRVVSTFNSKIVHAGISNYLFVHAAAPMPDARQAARNYFAQGHEIDFVQIVDWLTYLLATLGSECRAIFNSELVALIEARECPASVKVAWNDALRTVIGG